MGADPAHRPRVARGLTAFALLACLFATSSANAAIRRIQRVSGTSLTGTGAATWAQPTKPKNLLVAIVNVNDANDTITPPSGSGWTLAIRSDAAGRTGVAIYYWAAAPAQAGTSTWTIAAGCCLSNVVTLIEYAGAQLGSPLDRTGTWNISSGTNTIVSVSTSLATTQADEIAITGWTNDGSKTYASWTNSFNELVDTKPTTDEPQLGVADKVLTATGTIMAGVTLSAAQDAVAGAIATFKAETSTTRYWRCSIQSNFDDNTCWTSTSGGTSNDVPAPDTSGTMTAIFNSTGVGDAVIRFDPNLLSLQINTGYAGTVRQMTGGTQGLVGEWYDGTNFDTYMGTYIDGPISFSTASGWDTTYGNPRTGGTNGETFSVRWTGQVYAPVSGSYVFRGYTDDGVRLWVNGAQVINNFINKGESESVGTSITLTAGTWYDITLEYYENTGGAACELRWTHPSQASSIMVPAAYLRTKGSTGLQTDWYDGTNGVNTAAAASNFKHRALSRDINNNDTDYWDDRTAGMVTDSYDGDTFRVVWQGQVLAAYTEAYTFKNWTNDGARVWVNGQLVIDSWSSQASELTGSPTISMTAGQWYDIRVEFYEGTLSAEAQFEYQSTSQALTIIPATALRSAAALTLGSFTQAAGSFVGGTGRMDVNGTFSATGGTFTAPTQLTVNGAMTTAGATFTHNSGRVVLESTSSVAFNPGASNAFNDVLVNDGLVGYWNFDESTISSTSSAADLSGYGHTAYHVNTPTASATLAPLAFNNGKALQFTMATRHALRTPLTAELQPSDLTVAFWHKASQADAGGSDVINAGDNWMVRITTTQVQFIHRANNSWTSCAATRGTLDNVWHHVAASHATSSGTTIYVDGALITACSGANDTTAVAYDRSRHLWIGRHGDGDPNYDFDGLLDEVRIYKTSLSKSEISALANGYPDGYAAGTYTLGSNLTLAGDLYLNSGTLDVGATPYSITVGDDWLNNGGLFSARTGTVTLSGTGTYLQSGNEPFYNLSQTGNSYTQLGGRMTIDGTAAVSAGTLDTWGFATRVGNITDSGSGRYHPVGSCTLVPRSNVSPLLNSTAWLSSMHVEVPDEPNLVRFYRFDELHGKFARDDSGNGSTGTLQQGASWSTSKADNVDYVNWGAALFDGSDDSVQFTAPAATKVTVSAWINPSNSGDAFYRIVEMPAYKLYVSRAGGAPDNAMALQFQMVTANGTYVYQSAANAVSYGSWQHVAVTFDSTTFASGTASTWPQFYVNGVNSATAQVSTTTGAFSTNAGTAYIGDRSGSDRSFSGYIDEVRLYDAVLTSAQLANLASGRYPSGSSNYTVTLGSNFTTGDSIQVDSGVLDIGARTVTANGTSTPIAVNNGTLRIGAGTLTASAGVATQRSSTLAFSGSGILQIATGKSLIINGTLSTTTGTTPTIQSVSGAYAFTVNSDTANPYALLNIDGLTVKNTDTNGLNIAKATSTTFTKFQNIGFKNGTGARLLYINGDSIALIAPGCTFDLGAGARTTTNNVVVAGTGSRYLFDDRGTATSGIGVGEAYDSDNDATADGLADSGGSVAQWLWSSQTDLAGSATGFPTAAFDWSNFSYYATYVAMTNIDGTTDRIYVRTANGDASYSWDLPSGTGDIIGTPRWDTIGGVHYVFVSTTGGYVYKLVDSGTTLALAPSPWNTPYNQGTNATVTSPLLIDANYIYWAGNNTTSNPTLFRLSNASKGSATTQSLTAAVNAALALDSPSTLPYVMAATAGHFYRYDVTNNSAPTDSTTLNPAAVDGRISVLYNQLYAVDNAGKLTVVPTTTLGTATWTYQDTGTHGSCTSGSNCQAKNMYVNVDDYLTTGGKPRVVYGDKDGHVYIVRQNGSTTAGAVMTGYPLRPNNDTSAIVTSALYHSGILLVGNSNGKVYVINAFTATGPATPSLLQTYDFGTGVSIASISRNRTTNSNAGAYMVATSTGKLIYIPTTTDGDGFQ